MRLVFLPMLCRIAFLWSKSWRIGSAGIKKDTWAWLPFLSFRHTTPDGVTERQKRLPYSKRVSVQKQLTGDLSPIGVQIFRTFPSLSFFYPNSSCFTRHAVLQSFHSRGLVPACCAKCSSLGRETGSVLFTAAQQCPLSYDNSAHTQAPTLQWIAFNVRKESQASLAAGQAQDLISCTMSEDVQYLIRQ